MGLCLWGDYMGISRFSLLYRQFSWQRAGVLLLVTVLLCAASTSGCSANKPFLFMEAVESRKAPASLESYGLKHLPVVNPRKDLEFEGDNKANMVARQSIERVARQVGSADMVCIDIESWPTCNTCSKRARSLDRYIQVLDWFRAVNPAPKLGFFGRPPKHDYYQALKPVESSEYRDWQKHNDFYKPLGEQVDVIFPSLYARYDDFEGWVKHAVANLKEARKYGKPVYAFITPYFIQSDKPYRKQPLDPAFWQVQLETVYQHADGLIIWTGPLKVWREDDPWWKLTKAFLASRGAGQRRAGTAE